MLVEARVVGMLIGIALATALFDWVGGQTGRTWQPVDFQGMDVAVRTAAGVAVLGAVAASLRGR